MIKSIFDYFAFFTKLHSLKRSFFYTFLAFLMFFEEKKIVSLNSSVNPYKLDREKNSLEIVCKSKMQCLKIVKFEQKATKTDSQKMGVFFG